MAKRRLLTPITTDQLILRPDRAKSVEVEDDYQRTLSILQAMRGNSSRLLQVDDNDRLKVTSIPGRWLDSQTQVCAAGVWTNFATVQRPIYGIWMTIATWPALMGFSYDGVIWTPNVNFGFVGWWEAPLPTPNVRAQGVGGPSTVCVVWFTDG